MYFFSAMSLFVKRISERKTINATNTVKGQIWKKYNKCFDKTKMKLIFWDKPIPKFKAYI